MKPLLFTLLFVSAFALHAQDLLPSSELSPDKFVGRSKKIEPGLMLYGVKWYAGPQEVLEAFGPPCGKIVYDPENFALLYGQSHTLVFEHNELREVIIGKANERFRGRMVAEHPFFDQPDLVVAPGFNTSSRGVELDRLLGSSGFSFTRFIAKEQYSFAYTTASSAITLQFGFIMKVVSDGKFSDIGISSITIRGQ